jgi:hypothetical protein
VAPRKQRLAAKSKICPIKDSPKNCAPNPQNPRMALLNDK